MTDSKVFCQNCVHRKPIPGDCHISCTKVSAKVSAVKHGIDSWWFVWPFNFDPTWLLSCDGYEAEPANLPEISTGLADES